MNRAVGYVFDLDGVLWIGASAVPGAADTIEELRRRGMRLRFVSNTSSQSHADCLSKLGRLGFSVQAHEVHVASQVTARYLARLMPGASVCVLGSPGLVTELKDAGLRVRPVAEMRRQSVDFVVVGRDEGLHYWKLAAALRQLMAGAQLVAVNVDPTIPTAEGSAPGAGAIVASLTAMTSRAPDVMVGKPGTLLLEQATVGSGLPPGRWIMVGDSPAIDVAAGRAFGMRTVWVNSGDAVRCNDGDDCSADMVVNRVSELLPLASDSSWPWTGHPEH
jgi:HAD superfamily hydrolase (TIGR01450 family)